MRNLVFLIALAGCGMQATPSQRDEGLDFRSRIDTTVLTFCGDLAGACCPPDSTVSVKHCKDGLGCNLATNRCQACGNPGQPCCDGPHSPFSGKCYENPLDPKSCQACFSGASCDAGSHTCAACGTVEGGACCGPDAYWAVRRCSRDASSGRRLVCSDDWDPNSRCIPCGGAGQPSCHEGLRCDAGLTRSEATDTCVPCGALGQPSCDGVCNAGLETHGADVCVTPCGKVGLACCGGDNGTCDGRDAICMHGRCEPYPIPLCQPCSADDQCKKDDPDLFRIVCEGGRCRRHQPHDYYYTDACDAPPDPCAGVTCGPGDRCYFGKCLSCGYPGGECCDGPLLGIFEGCSTYLHCGLDNRCH